LVSFVKSLIVARYFGTTAAMDAFTLAFLVPNLLATLLTGSCALSLIPALAAAERKGRDERSNTFRSGLFLLLAAALVLGAALALFSREIMSIVAPRFAVPKLLLSATLLRWCALLVPLTVVYAFCSAELLSRRRYFAVAAAPVISTAVSIAAILLFPDVGVTILPIGLVGGNLLQAIAVLSPAWKANSMLEPLRWWSFHVKSLASQQLPLLLVSSLGVINMSVDQFMAGLLPSGRVAALGYATSLNAVVVQVVVMAASWVVLPDFSQLAAKNDLVALSARVRQGVLGVVSLAIPVSVLIFVQGGKAVQLLFQYGKFDQVSTQMVSGIWLGYTVGLLPFSVAIMPLRFISVLRKNDFLAKIGLIALPLNAALDYILMLRMGPTGISLSTSAVYVWNCFLVLLFVHRLVPHLFDWKLCSAILRATAISAVGGALLYGSRQIFTATVNSLVVGTILFSALVLTLYYLAGLVEMPSRSTFRI